MVKANRAAYYPHMPVWIGVALGRAVGYVGRLLPGRAMQEPSGAFGRALADIVARVVLCVAAPNVGLLTAKTLE